MVIYNLNLEVHTKSNWDSGIPGVYKAGEPVRSLSSQFTSFKRLYSLLVEEYKLAKAQGYQIRSKVNTVRV